jgi:hypothetical protein
MEVQAMSLQNLIETIDAPGSWDEPEEVATPTPTEEAPIEEVLTFYQDKLSAMKPPMTDIELQSWADLHEELKLTHKRYEAKRKAKVDPLNKQVKEINEYYMPKVKGLEEMARRSGEVVSRRVEELRQAAEREQQRLIEEAKKAEADRIAKAEAERKAAEEAKAQGNEVAAVEHEAKAEMMELEAVQAAAPPVVQVQSRTLNLGTSKLTAGKFTPTWLLPGWDGKERLTALDDRLRPIVGDPEKLPANLRWLLAHCEVSSVLLNASVKTATSFPSPFTITKKPGATTLRGGKE